MKFRVIFLVAGLIGLVAVMAVLLNLARQDSPRPIDWPPTLVAQPCMTASLFLDQRLAVDRDLAEVTTDLAQAWREQGWQAVADLRADGQAATLTARRGDQAFEANLTWEDGTFHLLAIGKHTCAPEDRE